MCLGCLLVVQMTPEGLVKDQAKKLLAQYKIYPASKVGSGPEGRSLPLDAAGWYWMPIKGASFGVRGIPDFEGHYLGLYFGLEIKRKTKKAEGFQKLQVEAIQCSGGACFVVDGPDSLKVFEGWLERVGNDPHLELSRMLRNDLL